MLIIYLIIFINLYFWSIIGFVYYMNNENLFTNSNFLNILMSIFWPLTLFVIIIKNLLNKIINFLKPEPKITVKMRENAFDELTWDDDGKFITLHLFNSELNMVFSYLPISIKNANEIIVATQELKNYANKLIDEKNKLIEEDSLKNKGCEIKISKNRKISII